MVLFQKEIWKIWRTELDIKLYLKPFVEPGPVKPKQGYDEVESLSYVKKTKLTSGWGISNRWLSGDSLHIVSLFKQKIKRDFRRLDIFKSLNAIQLVKWICYLNLFPDWSSSLYLNYLPLKELLFQDGIACWANKPPLILSPCNQE